MDRPMKMPEKIDERLFAPCGMNCMVCCRALREAKALSRCFGRDGGKPATAGNAESATAPGSGASPTASRARITPASR